MPNRQVAFPGRPVYGKRPDKPKSRRVWVSWDRIKLIGKVLLLGAAIVFAYRLFTIKSITVTGTSRVSSQRIEVAAQASMSRHWLARNLLTLSVGKFESDLLSGQSEIKSVEVNRQWPNRLQLIVTERQPTLNWETGGVNYLLDLDGTIIGPSDVSLPTVVDSTNLPVKPGDRVAPTQFVDFAARLADLLKQKKLGVVEMRVPDTTSELYIKVTKGYVVKFDTERGAEAEVNDLEKVLATLAQLNKTPAEYIDLRIEGKAYYR